MSDFLFINCLKSAEDACFEGHLIKALLFPVELGGEDRTENVTYIPPLTWEIKRNSTAELLDAVRKGMSDIAVVPEYCSTSFVPTKITLTAAKPGMPPGYILEIGIW